MPIKLDKLDIAILKSLMEDGRKSFRQISRETGITTPTVKSRFERLVNVGFIKGVQPIFDFERIINTNKENLIHLQNFKETVFKNRNDINKKHKNNFREQKVNTQLKKQLIPGLTISLVCDFCDGPVSGKPHILRFANLERFFCCSSCKTGYSEKYRGRIESIKRKYEGKSEMEDSHF